MKLGMDRLSAFLYYVTKRISNSVSGWISNLVSSLILNLVSGRISNLVSSLILYLESGHISNLVSGRISNLVSGRISNLVYSRISNLVCGWISNLIPVGQISGQIDIRSLPTAAKWSVFKGFEQCLWDNVYCSVK